MKDNNDNIDLMQVKEMYGKEFAELTERVSLAEAAVAAAKKPKPGEVKVARDYENWEDDLNSNLGEGQDKVDAIKAMDVGDIRLSGITSDRILAITGTKRQIVGEGAEADATREMFGRFNNFSDILTQVITPALKGGAGHIEQVWGLVDGKFIYENLIPRSPAKFKFDKDNNTLLVTEDNSDGAKVADNKFQTLTYRSEFGNKYGFGLYEQVYKMYAMKKIVFPFWGQACEKKSTGVTTVGLPEGGVSSENMGLLEAFIKGTRVNTGVILPFGMTVDIKHMTGDFSRDFEMFISAIDKAYAILILGQTLTSDIGNVGSKAAATVHNKVRQDILAADTLWVENYINDGLIMPYINFNFPNVKEYPKWRLSAEEGEDLEALAKVLDILTKLGFKTVPTEWIHEKFSIPIPADGSPVLELPGAGAAQPGESGTNLWENRAKWVKALYEIV